MDTSRMTDYVKSNYIPVTESGCWLWLGSWHKTGYGKLSSNGRNTIVVPRLFYTHFKGPIPDGLHVCHKCDTPACCNPDHLFLGEPKDNAVDREMKQRGRHAWYIPKRARRARHKPYATKLLPSPQEAGND